jgi:hypothetical protein
MDRRVAPRDDRYIRLCEPSAAIHTIDDLHAGAERSHQFPRRLTG